MSAGFNTYPWGDNRPFYSLAACSGQRYGGRVQKVSNNARFAFHKRFGKVAKGWCYTVTIKV